MGDENNITDIKVAKLQRDLRTAHERIDELEEILRGIGESAASAWSASR